MLFLPVAIVALLFSFIVGPLTLTERIHTRGKLLGHRFYHKLSSLRAHRSATLGPQDYRVNFETIAIETLSTSFVETITAENTSSLAPPCDYTGSVVSEVSPAQLNDQPFPAPAPVFVVDSQSHGPFRWRDLLNYRVFEGLALVFISVGFPSIAIPRIAKLFSRSESPDKIEPPVDEPPKLLPPRYLTPPPIVQIRILDRNSRSNSEPIFPPAPPKLPPFWFACEYPLISSRHRYGLIASSAKEQQQDRPSSPTPLLHLLDLPSYETEPQEQRTPHLSFLSH